MVYRPWGVYHTHRGEGPGCQWERRCKLPHTPMTVTTTGLIRLDIGISSLLDTIRDPFCLVCLRLSPLPSYFEGISLIIPSSGNVGLSRGYPGVNTSLAGQFGTVSKLVLCAMMVRGRHRELPYEIDRAVSRRSPCLFSFGILPRYKILANQRHYRLFCPGSAIQWMSRDEMNRCLCVEGLHDSVVVRGATALIGIFKSCVLN